MKVAVVGATGLVGSKMLQVLAERNFPVTELILVASERSIGKEVEFKGAKYKVVGYADAIAAKPAVAIFSAGGGTAESEIWTDASVLQAAYQRGNSYQSVYAKLA